MLRPCLGTPHQRCGKVTPQSRCPICRQVIERARPPRPTTLARTHAEQQRRKATVTAHIEQHGMVCPGWQCPPHEVTAPNILTADHVMPVGAGGQGDGPLQVLCRVCNGRKSSRIR